MTAANATSTDHAVPLAAKAGQAVNNATAATAVGGAVPPMKPATSAAAGAKAVGGMALGGMCMLLLLAA
jgi:hypothetical protein